LGQWESSSCTIDERESPTILEQRSKVKLITMERLFSPSTRSRYRDILESHGRLEEFRAHRVQELNLNASIEELVSAESAFTYADLYAMLGNKDTVVWLTPHAAVARRDKDAKYSWTCCLCFNADGNNKGLVAFSRSPEHLLEICDVVLRLLAASDVRSVKIHKLSSSEVVLISAPALAYLLQQCQSLKCLTLKDLALDESHCRALGDYSRPGLELLQIVLTYCQLINAGTRALVEVLGRNQGPTELNQCYTDYCVLADGLRGNSSLKTFIPRIFSNEVGIRELLAIAGALKENRGLVDLHLTTSLSEKSDETWCAICDSLKTHPTLEVLNLRSVLTEEPIAMTSRLQMLLNMMKVNLSIQMILLPINYGEHNLFQESVIPYLKTNGLRPRLLALQKTRPIAYRAKVLRRALLSARTNANTFWMLLSGNAEVAFPSKAATATLTANQAASATSSASATAVAASTFSVSTVDSVA
jgi:hypothetical protein